MTATCRHCGQIFTDPAVIGENLNAAFVRFVTKLTRHMERGHPKEWTENLVAMSIAAQQFAGMMMLDNFITTDEAVRRNREQLGAQIVRLFGRKMSDEDIEEMITDHGQPGDTPLRSACRSIAQHIRDILLFADVKIPEAVGQPGPQASPVPPA